MNIQLWLAYAALETGLSFAPGPAVFTITAQAVRHGWRRSFFGNVGVLSGNLLYFTLSAAGVGAFIAASPRLYGALRYGGIAYLAYTALGLLIASWCPAQGQPAVRAAEGSARALFAQGMTTQLSNPKAIVFFVSFLAPFVDPVAAWPVPIQIAVYAITTAGLETPILLLYGFAAAHGSRLLLGRAVGPWQDRVAGTSLLAAASWLALRR